MSEGLRGQVEAAALAELERVGPEAFDRTPVVRRFAGEGASARTIYRWISDLIDSGRAGQHLARVIAEAAATRAARVPDPANDAAREAVAALPRFVTPETIAGTGPIALMDELRQCIEAARQLMGHARTPEGTVKNAKLLLNASGTLRQCLDTALRVFEAVRELSELDKFHAAIIVELGKESPELAERVVARLRVLCDAASG